jgi:hypothetical protein
MYAQSFLVTSVRGSGLEPTTEARAGLGCIGFMNAALGVRFLAAFLVAFFLAVVFLAGLRALFLADFFAAFFLVAIACLPVFVRTLRAAVPQNSRDQQYTTGPELQ